MSSKRSQSAISASPAPSKQPADKKSRSTSCYLCQKRKQKCDQRMPSCTNCIKSKAECVQPPRYGELNKSNVKDDYTILLEKKVKQLEAILKQDNGPITTLSKKYQPIGDLIESSETNNISVKHPQSINTDGLSRVSNVTGTGDSSLSKNDTLKLSSAPLEHAPNNGTITSGISNNVSADSHNIGANSKDQSAKQQYEQPKSYNHFELVISSAPSQFLLNQKQLLKKSILYNVNLSQYLQHEPFMNVDPKLAKTFQDMYFRGVQTLYPLFDEIEITTFRHKYFNMSPIFSGQHNDYHFLCARMFLINAIASLQFNNTGRYRGPDPLCFFSTALRHLVLLSDNLVGLHKIEILFLMVFFLSRADTDTINIHLLIADSIKTCTELSLHKSKAYQNITPDIRSMKLRAFWCIYLLERSICLAIAKPFILKESKIESSVPLFPDTKKGVSFINQSIKIRRIESRFIEQLKILSSAAMVSKSQLPHVGAFFQELQNWRNDCQHFQSPVESETLSMNYYSSIRNLVQPYLELLDPENKLFKECQAAAGQICQTIKSLHHKTVSGYSLLNIHSTFIAGITLIYCLWLQRNRDDMRRKLLGDDKKHTRPTVSEELFTGLDDLRACSVSLYVMSERTKFALSFRDTFEEIMNATIGNLILRCGPDSSEILLPWYASQMNTSKSESKENKTIVKSDNTSCKNTESDNGSEQKHSLAPIQNNSPMVSKAGYGNYDSSSTTKFSKPSLTPALHSISSKLKGLPPATVRRPLLHFGFETVDVPRPEDEKKEEEERIRMGKWTRSTIPKGLSHLLSAPVPMTETETGSGENEDEKVKEDVSPTNSTEPTPTISSRLLPPPLVSQLGIPPPASRLTSSLTNIGTKSIDGCNPPVAQTPSNVRKVSHLSHGTVDGISPVRNYSIASMSPINPSPISGTVSNNTGIVNSWFMEPNTQGIHGTVTNNQQRQTRLQEQQIKLMQETRPSGMIVGGVSETPTLPTYISTPDAKDLATTSNTSGSTTGNRTSYTYPQIPELFPFVGRTTNMINNISVWTGESGQQIPQTGLQIRDANESMNTQGVQQPQPMQQPQQVSNQQQQYYQIQSQQGIPQSLPFTQQNMQQNIQNVNMQSAHAHQQQVYYQQSHQALQQNQVAQQGNVSSFAMSSSNGQYGSNGSNTISNNLVMNLGGAPIYDQDNILIPSTPYYNEIGTTMVNSNENYKVGSLGSQDLSNVNRRDEWNWEVDCDFGFFP